VGVNTSHSYHNINSKFDNSTREGTEIRSGVVRRRKEEKGGRGKNP
jgi:hypothetical protein